MSNTATEESISLDAWRKLKPTSANPSRIDVLKNIDKSFVCRLVGVGPQGTDVIAKRRARDKAAVERIIYEEILPEIGMQTMEFYGYVEEVCPLSSKPHGWLFIEDIGEQHFSSHIPMQRTLLAEWLGTFHAKATDLNLKDRLPDRGPVYHRSLMQATLDQLPSILSSESLDAVETAVLENILNITKQLEAQWGEIERFSSRLPETVIHSDCLPKNVHVRNGHDGLSVIPLDWSAAGRGLLGIDLGHTVLPWREALPEAIDIVTYHTAVSTRWPLLDLATLQKLAQLGQLFWAIDVISGCIAEFTYPWANREKRITNFQIYERVLVETSNVAGWGEDGCQNQNPLHGRHDSVDEWADDVHGCRSPKYAGKLWPGN